jgi:hypothetical protein
VFKNIFVSLLIGICTFITLRGQEIVGKSDLKITVKKLAKGAEIASIKKGDTELLSGSEYIFILEFDGETMNSHDGWGSVVINNDGENCAITFKQPEKHIFPEDFEVNVIINVTGQAAEWDMNVKNLDTKSLLNARFPRFNIKTAGNDYFFIPRYSGKLIPAPYANSINYTLSYPRGWSSTMQFSAYYNSDYGIYLGTHDPKASLKNFIIKKAGKGILYENITPVPDKTKTGNDWDFSGTFRFELFTGDWFDAAQIYKHWVFENADYRPRMDSRRIAAQQAIGNISVWTSYADPLSDDKVMAAMNKFQKAVGVPLGMHWYRWNTKDFDDDYPDFFPERTGMADLVEELQKDGNIICMPYINGRLYDKDLPDYQTKGLPGATKNSAGVVYSQTFNGNHFAVMCPTYEPYQDILSDAGEKITDELKCKGLYLDMVCAASVKECMDKNHNHTLGGGNYWRHGYRQMFNKIFSKMPSQSNFVTVEGGCDYLADVVDGFLVDGWQTDNMVPAFQAVYAGKVQTFGTRTGASIYNKQDFYCRLSQTFVYGTQPGRFFTYLASDPNGQARAFPFVVRMAKMRYKLRHFLSFGEMLRPLKIDRTNIPDITSKWLDYSNYIDVKISALQLSLWKNKNGDKIALVFANASMTDNLNFSFNFDGSKYDFKGKIKVQKISENEDGEIVEEDNSFSKNVSLAPMDVIAYIFEGDTTTTSIKNYNANKHIVITPNPAGDYIDVILSKAKNPFLSVKIYDVLGVCVLTHPLTPSREGESIRIDVSGLAAGVYFVRVGGKMYKFVKM